MLILEPIMAVRRMKWVLGLGHVAELVKGVDSEPAKQKD